METQVEKVTKSQQIRQLLDSGLSVSEVAKQLGVRYNFVYNVAQRYFKAQGKTLPRRTSKAKQIMDLVAKGYTIDQIKQELGLEYSQVYQVIRRYRKKEKEGGAIQKPSSNSNA